MTVNAKAWSGLLILAVVMGVLLFAPAGTVHYWQAWVYLTIFIGSCALTTLYLKKIDPALLARRVKGGPTAEKRPAQKIIMLLMTIGFFALLVVPALDHRFGWTHASPAVVVTGDVLIVIGFILTCRVYRENTYTSATIEVVENQKVISTGPYSIVRHPMYASALLYVLGTPIALGSWWGLISIVVLIPGLIWRLFDEERMLAASLPGYVEYQNRVRHRLVPFVW